ncbi:hypothetical protein JXA12_02070, partial [Candidatus Woesearchaeota archaeon]|nr:hypothetical protein [Candidatus Woesearchaeota archaeon]
MDNGQKEKDNEQKPKETNGGMDRKRFLFVSYDALISDVAWNVLKEGNEVKYYIQSDEDKDIADGFVPKTDDWERELPWADIVVFDDVLG